MLARIAARVADLTEWHLLFTITRGCSLTQQLIISPVVAEGIAKAGFSKKDFKKYLYDHARKPALEVEKITGEWMTMPPMDLCESWAFKTGGVKAFCESKDPNRMVPIVCSPDDFLITVSGEPLRTNAYIFLQNGNIGRTTSNKIQLPKNWDALLAEAKKKK
jgi:hypothetical protein